MNAPLFLSLGLGVQSTCLLHMAISGEIEKPVAAVFADTGWESRATYNALDKQSEACKKAGIELIVCSGGNLRNDLLEAKESGRFVSIPFHTENDGQSGMMRRQCTNDYKIKPVRNAIKAHLLKLGEKKSARLQIGISWDEVHRMKPSGLNWLVHCWPLIEKRMSRANCLKWMAGKGLPAPARSSCLGCPFHSNQEWRDLKEASPAEWQDTVMIDREIRKLPRLDGTVFLHRSCSPLDEAFLGLIEGQGDLFGNECEGMCGV